MKERLHHQDPKSALRYPQSINNVLSWENRYFSFNHSSFHEIKKAMWHNVASKSFLSFWKKKLRQVTLLLKGGVLNALFSPCGSLWYCPFVYRYAHKSNSFLFHAAEKWDLMESSRNCRCLPMLYSSNWFLLSMVILYFFLGGRK